MQNRSIDDKSKLITHLDWKSDSVGTNDGIKTLTIIRSLLKIMGNGRWRRFKCIHFLIFEVSQ